MKHVLHVNQWRHCNLQYTRNAQAPFMFNQSCHIREKGQLGQVQCEGSHIVFINQQHDTQ